VCPSSQRSSARWLPTALRGFGAAGSARCEVGAGERSAPARRSATVRRARRPVGSPTSSRLAGVGPDAGFRGSGTDHPAAASAGAGVGRPDGEVRGVACFEGRIVPFDGLTGVAGDTEGAGVRRDVGAAGLVGAGPAAAGPAEPVPERSPTAGPSARRAGAPMAGDNGARDPGAADAAGGRAAVG
jgi:hypothetical protein